MFIRATRQIIDWDAESGSSLILNVGDTDTLSPTMLAKHEGSWEPADGTVFTGSISMAVIDDGTLAAPKLGSEPITDPLDHDGDGEPGGSIAPADHDGDLHSLRERYEALAGKRVFNGWDADTLRGKITELEAMAIADDLGDEGDAPAA